MLSAEPHVIRSGNLEIRPAQRIALLDGVEIRLRPKTFDLLVILVSNSDRVLAREELQANLWADVSVSKNSLAQCIIELRKALRDDARQPARILTVAKAGYRWAGVPEPAVTLNQPVSRRWVKRFRPPVALGLVLAFTSIAAAVWWRGSSSSSAPGTRQVAVVRFENQSGQPDLDWLRDGLPDMVSTTMSRSGHLKLITRDQLYRNRSPRPGLDSALERARATNCDAVVVGTFSRIGDRMRVDARIYDSASGNLIGAENITVGEISRVLEQIDVLAARLAGRVAPRSEKGSEPALAAMMTSNLEAYRYYSLGIEKADRYQTAEAVALFENALALDPEFTMAAARIGYALAVTDHDLAKGRSYLERAFRNAAKLSGRDRSYILAWYAIANRDYADAIRRYSALIASYPNDVEAHRRLAVLFRGESRHEEAVEVLQRALGLDPREPRIYNSLAVTYSEMSRHTEAIAMADRYVSFDSANVNALDTLALTCLMAGELDRAEELLDRALNLAPNFWIAAFHRMSVYYATGRVDKALAEGRRIGEHASDDRTRMRAWLASSWIASRQGSWAEARAAEVRAARIPHDPSERWHRFPGPGPAAEAALRTPIPGRGSRWGLRLEEFVRAEEARLRGDQQARLEHLRRMLGYRPSLGEYETFEDALGDALRELGRTHESIAEYERALTMFPGMARARFHLAQAYASKGRTAESKAEFARFRKLWKNPDSDPR